MGLLDVGSKGVEAAADALADDGLRAPKLGRHLRVALLAHDVGQHGLTLALGQMAEGRADLLGSAEPFDHVGRLVVELDRRQRQRCASLLVNDASPHARAQHVVGDAIEPGDG